MQDRGVSTLYRQLACDYDSKALRLLEVRLDDTGVSKRSNIPSEEQQLVRKIMQIPGWIPWKLQKCFQRHDAQRMRVTVRSSALSRFPFGFRVHRHDALI